MSEKLQFTTRNALLATAILAVWYALFVAGFRRVPAVQGAAVVSLATNTVMAVLPATAVGAFLGRAGLGALCGLAGIVGVLHWRSFGT